MNETVSSLGKFKNVINNGNLHAVLADLAKAIFIGLGFFDKKLFYGMNTLSFSFMFVRFIFLTASS